MLRARGRCIEQIEHHTIGETRLPQPDSWSE
jgi:hypothetical protein